MAETNLTSGHPRLELASVPAMDPERDDSPLLKLADRLHSQLSKSADIEALLSCAADSLRDINDDESQSAHRVIRIAKALLVEIRNQIDEAALEAIRIASQKG